MKNLSGDSECNGSKNEKTKQPEKPTIPDIPKDSPATPSSSMKDPTIQVQKEKPSFSLPVRLSPLKKPEAKSKDSTFIKVDYLKPEKTEKTIESVARILDFAQGKLSNGAKIDETKKPEDEAKNEEVVARKLEIEIKKPETEAKKPEDNIKVPEEVRQPEHEIKESESEIAKCETVMKIPAVPITIKVEKDEIPPIKAIDGGKIRTDVKKEHGSSSSKHSSSSTKSSSHHSSSNNPHKSHSSSSHHKSSSSSHKSSSHNSSRRDCSRCYRRSKIKKVTVGVQVRPDESSVPKPPTRQLEFEASHRVGVNRRPINIGTNLSYLKFGRFYHIEVHPNGGASIVHMYQDELDTLKPEEMNELVEEFFELVFSEDENGYAFHVMGVVHDGARYLPDLLEHMAENYSNLTVKSGVIGRNNDIETCTMMQYYEQVLKNYQEGTVRHGPLHQISLVGKVHEEVGGYFPDLIGKLEISPFLKKAMPWGKMSIVQMDPRLSNDGPILWIRPGEQLIPTAEMTKTPLKRQRARTNELRNLQYLPRASEAREIMFEDRTKAHADHVGMGHERQTTAAVGKFNQLDISSPRSLNHINITLFF